MVPILFYFIETLALIYYIQNTARKAYIVVSDVLAQLFQYIWFSKTFLENYKFVRLVDTSISDHCSLYS